MLQALNNFLWSFAGLALVSPCLFHTGDTSTGHSPPDVSYQCLAERKAPPSYLLVMLCLMQPRRLFIFATREFCWLMHNLLSIKTPRPNSAKLFSSQSAPSLYWGMGLFLLGCKTLHFPLLNFTRLILQLIIAIKKSINPVL